MKKKPIILVLEDENPLLAAIKDKLEHEGLETVTARSVDQGINLLKDLPRIDAIWLDHYLLGPKDGIEFVAEVKKNDDWKHIPIFVVTNTASPEKTGSYLHLGVTKFFTKASCPLADIISDIKKIIS